MPALSTWLGVCRRTAGGLLRRWLAGIIGLASGRFLAVRFANLVQALHECRFAIGVKGLHVRRQGRWVIT